MTVYYTAKDIEEMAARGVRQLEIGPGITLTDFARETALQLDIELVDPRKERKPAPAPAAAPAPARSSSGSKYNKPPGCMHGPLDTAAPPPANSSATPATEGSSSTVNRLIDLMGKVMNRGE